MADHLRFTQAAIALRNSQPALRGEGLNVFYTSDADRVIAFHRWVQGEGRDVVVVATLSETTWGSYQLGFPSAGRWIEIFNSDAYDSCNANGALVNPQVTGNNGSITACGPPLHNLPTSATIVIPANAVVVFMKG
jgi:1,4-alpha-glucan branching enzyme